MICTQCGQAAIPDVKWMRHGRELCPTCDNYRKWEWPERHWFLCSLAAFILGAALALLH